MTFTEVIKVEDGAFCNPSAHIKRMVQTANHFFGCDIDVSAFVEDSIPFNLRKGVVKCRVVYSDKILSIEFQPYIYRTIRKLALVEDNEIEYSFKYQDRNRLNGLLEQRGDADDILIVKNGLITDTSFSNVVFRDRSGGLFTPDSYLLAGTKRQRLLENGIIHERKISVNDLSHYLGIYVINTMVDIRDAAVIDLHSHVLSLHR